MFTSASPEAVTARRMQNDFGNSQSRKGDCDHLCQASSSKLRCILRRLFVHPYPSRLRNDNPRVNSVSTTLHGVSGAPLEALEFPQLVLQQ